MPCAYAAAKRWYAWRRPSRTTVAVAVWHEDRLLMVSHSYKGGVTLPGGGARRRETPESAAIRELREETGIVVAPSALRLADVSTNVGRYGARTVYLYEVRLDAVPPIRANGWETTGAAFVKAREAGIRGRSADLRRYVETALACGGGRAAASPSAAR